MQRELKQAVDVLCGCAERAGVANEGKREWFAGYAKACEDIKRMVIDRAFNGEPLPVRWRQRNECPECKRT